MRKCIFCGKPLKLKLGAEHIKCALRHPYLSLAGWVLYIFSFRGAEEKIKNRIRKKGVLYRERLVRKTGINSKLPMDGFERRERPVRKTSIIIAIACVIIMVLILLSRSP